MLGSLKDIDKAGRHIPVTARLLKIVFTTLAFPPIGNKLTSLILSHSQYYAVLCGTGDLGEFLSYSSTLYSYISMPFLTIITSVISRATCIYRTITVIQSWNKKDQVENQPSLQ